MKTPSGRLLHRRGKGDAGIEGQLDDYAFMIHGLIELYEADFDLRDLEEAVALARTAAQLFGNSEGRFFTTSDGTDLPIRLEAKGDDALPSGHAILTCDLFRLSEMTGDDALRRTAEKTLASASGAMLRDPMSHATMLRALEIRQSTSIEVVIAGNRDTADTKAMLDALRSVDLPTAVVILRPDGDGAVRLAKLAPFTREQKPIDGKATAYVCVQHACRLPTTDPAKMLEQLH